MHILLAIFTFAVWSSVFSIGKVALTYADPLFLTGFRMTLAGVLLFAYLFFRRRESLRLTVRQLLSLCLLGFFSVYLANVLEFWGLKHLSAAKTCFIYGLSPFFTALFSYLHFKEKMTGKKWLGFAIGMIGFIPVLSMQTGEEGLWQALGFLSWPEIAVMGAAISAVYGWVLLRMAVKTNDISPLAANTGSMLFGGILAFSHSLFVENWNPVPIVLEEWLPMTQSVLCLIFVSNLLCYNLYGYLLKKFTATFLSFLGLFSPIFASFNAWLLIGEAPSWQIFLSTAILLLGAYLIYKEELRQGYILRKIKVAEQIA